MNIQSTIYRLALSVLVTCSIGFNASECEAQKANSLHGLVIQVRTDKSQYVLGEPVSLLIRIVNRSSVFRTLPQRVDVFTGEVEVLVAGETGQYREYIGPQWGIKDVLFGAPTDIAPGGAYTTKATLLFNHALELEDANPRFAQRLSSKRLDTPYAFAQPGRFRIRAVLKDFESGKKIESMPASVRIVQPEGGDLAVWRLMKADPEYAFFIQSGSSMGQLSSGKSQTMVRNLERILKEHPDSRMSSHISAALTRHRSLERAVQKEGVLPPDR